MIQSNIEKLKQQIQLQGQVKEILAKDFVDIQDPLHFRVPPVLKQILDKEKKTRTENDLIYLSMALSKIKFFSEMSKTTSQEEMLMLYKELSFIQLPARRTLFNIGDIGRNFYIILSGSVWVLVAKSGLGDGTFAQKQPSKEKIPSQQVDEGCLEDEHEFSEYEDERMLQLKYPNLMKVGQIESEGSFGEIALTNFIPRQATIVCREDTQFIKLSREAFNKFLSEYYNRIQQRNFNFLKQVSIFLHWQDAELSQMQYHLQPVEYMMNNVIFREGEINKQASFEIRGVYFIQEGAVEVCENFYIGYEVQQSLRRSTSTKSMQIKLSRLGYGQVFGYAEFLEGADLRETRAVCISEKVKLLFLAADRFKLYCSDEQTTQELNLLMEKQQQAKDKYKRIYNGANASQHSFKNTSISNETPKHMHDTTTQGDSSTIIQPSKKGKRVKDVLGSIAHQSSKIQSYQLFLQSHNKDDSNKELNFEKPLIEIQPSYKQRAQNAHRIDFPIVNKTKDTSRMFLIQKLKLPKIYKNPLKVEETAQLQIFKYVKSKNLSKF